MKRFVLLPILLITLTLVSCGVNQTETGSGSTQNQVQKPWEITYREYNAKEFFEKRGHEPILLFFYTPSAPDNRLIDTYLREQGNLLNGNILVYKVDYDLETLLKKEFKVAVANTIVALDQSGKVQTLKMGISSLKDIQEVINSTLGNANSATLDENAGTTLSAPSTSEL